MPFIGGGGVEKNLFIIANYLSEKFAKIGLCTLSKNKLKNFNKKIKHIGPYNNFNDKLNIRLKYLICLVALFKFLIKNRNSVVFAFQANIYCIILAIIFRKKIVTRSNSSPSGWNKNIFKNFLFRLLLKYPTKIIVNSKSFKKEIDKKFKINSKMIYNPLNKEEIISKSKVKIKKDFFNRNKQLRIINVARFTDQKDHITLLKAFHIVSKKIPTNLLLIGYGNKKTEIKNYIKLNRLDKKVKILDFAFNPYKYIKNSDLFILTSLYEGLPNVLLESIALKKYVISSNCPTGPSEILENNKYGSLFPLKNYRKLSKIIIDFYFNKKKYNKKITKAFKSLDRFDEINNCRLYLIEIKKLIGIN